MIGKDGREYGPVSAEQVQDWLLSNRLNTESSVKSDKSGVWVTLKDLPELSVQVEPPLSNNQVQPPLLGELAPTESQPSRPAKMLRYNDGTSVHGPIEADKVLALVKQRILKGDVSVNVDGTDSWVPFKTLKDSTFSSQAVETFQAAKHATQRTNSPATSILGSRRTVSVIVFALMTAGFCFLQQCTGDSNNPFYKQGYHEGQDWGSKLSKYRSEREASHSDQQLEQQGYSLCPGDVRGEDRDFWAEGFKDGFKDSI